MTFSPTLWLLVSWSIFNNVVSAREGEIPVIDGVPGGISSDATAAFAPSSESVPVARQVGKLRYVENSGVCETTPGVYQASGYGEIATNKSIWFWFFEARSKNASAPIAVWLNGGPGSSSMIGLFQENGPCRINADMRTVSHNNFSWNNEAHMLFIDQPVSVGFSHGTTGVGTSKAAAVEFWQFLQVFFNDARFQAYSRNPFAIWTESYGGHYGPVFAAHILKQNAAIASGSLTGRSINLKTLGIGNGLTDPLVQYPGYSIYAKTNPYRQTASDLTIAKANASFHQVGGCQDLIRACYQTSAEASCSRAQSWCNANVLGPPGGNSDIYDIRAPVNNPYPPSITKYLTNDTLAKLIGAETTWKVTSAAVYRDFGVTGDWMYNHAPELEAVIDADIRVVIYAGDADYIVNYIGIEQMVANLKTKFSATLDQGALANWTVAGYPAGLVRQAGSLTYLRVFGAGHEVPAYNHTGLDIGQAALQFFNQATQGRPLTST